MIRFELKDGPIYIEPGMIMAIYELYVGDDKRTKIDMLEGREVIIYEPIAVVIEKYKKSGYAVYEDLETSTTTR